MKIQIEIRPGEGGDDARLLVGEQAAIYAAYARTRGIDLDVLEEAKAAIG